jgi:hypothetical protein
MFLLDAKQPTEIEAFPPFARSHRRTSPGEL